MNDLNNATPCNIIQALIYRKYQRRIHHACIILHTPRYLITYSNQTIKMKCLTTVEMFMYSQMVTTVQNVV